MFRRHPVIAPITIAYLAAVAWVTLTPGNVGQKDTAVFWLYVHIQRYAGSSSVLAHWATYPHLEFTLNVVLFLPIGLFPVLLLGWRRWWVGLALSIASTGAIEFVQRYIPGRVSDIRDVASNSLGGAIGVVIGIGFALAASKRLRRH
ncbi:VanZ family protein [Gryllotalpicola sp.]|uniref:VanZ family protein n=1 Tax=Gryllotalpicola sp. TaxID=1932787 RepID=UPI002634C0B3|nr:VanZ family protein [Gryllotalpicola sp.]